MLSSDTLDMSDPKKMASRLHRQFGHPNSRKLITLIKNAGIVNTQLEREVKKVSEQCITCVKYRRPASRPVVSVPLATTFNETVAIDLKIWGKNYFLVLIDVATRFCAARVIKNKEAPTIMKGLFLSWITLFGAPKKIFSDCGGEFNNEEMRALGEAYNMRVLTTAAESPWSNGVCERLNGVIGNLVSKIIEDTNCDLETALAWAISSRNALVNQSGFSPNQLVFGFNPAIPDIFHSEPPALEEVTASDTVLKNLSAQKAARQGFIQFESNEKLKRALRNKIRGTNVEDVERDDWVYYKRNESNEWRGPGKVMFRDGKIIFVRHGGTFVRVHECRLAKAPISEYSNREGDVQENDKENKENEVRQGAINKENMIPKGKKGQRYSTMDDDSDDDFLTVTVNRKPSNQTTGKSGSNLGSEVPTDGINSENEPINTSIEAQVQPQVPDSSERKEFDILRMDNGVRIKGIHSSTGEFISGKIVSRAGKIKGKNKFCYNVERDSDGTKGWLDLSKMNDLSIVPDNVEMIVMYNSEAVTQAKHNEIRKWREHNVYEEVEDIGQKRMSVRWVLTEKVKEKKPDVNARLVARGFEEDTEKLRKDSPTCSKEGVRIVYAIGSSKGWKPYTIDIKAAYLQGGDIGREVYLKPPPEFDEGKLWKLKKAVYGLCDAARTWYLQVKRKLLALSVKMCSLDNSLFRWYNNGMLEGLICIHVDDFLYCGTKEFENQVVGKIRKEFQIGTSASGSFKYLGLNVMTNNEGVTVDQIQYAASLSTVEISYTRAMQKNSELSEQEKEGYRALIGQLSWMSTHTRPDIAYDTCELSIAYKQATVSDLVKLNKLLERVKKDRMRLYFPKLLPIGSCKIECYTDASFAKLPDGGSQGALIVFLKDEEGTRCPIYWRSRKLRRIVKSTFAAETMALLEGAETAVYLACILKEVTGCKEIPITCLVDNKSLVDALKSTNKIDDNRLRVDLAVLDDMLSRKEICEVQWVDTTQQLADCLTKRGASTERLRAAISRD